MYVMVDGVKFELLNWDFVEDGFMGGVYFLVPRGIYKYIEGGNNGAYVWEYPENPSYDRARAACPCFDVNGNSENTFWRCSLKDIAQSAAEFIDMNIPRK